MKKKFYISIFALLLNVIILGVPALVVAGTIEYRPLAPVPALGINNSMTLGGEDGLTSYLNSWVIILIRLATALAVLYVVYGGIKYTLTDSFSSKADAKATIMRALGGLLLALTSYMILNTINPALLTGRIRSLQDVSVGTISGGPKGPQDSAIQAVLEPYNSSNAMNFIYPGDPSYPYTPEDKQWGTAVAVPAKSPTTGKISSSNLNQWGDPSAINMQGQVVQGRQLHYAPGEAKSDSGTDRGEGAFGQQLVVGTPTQVGSAASSYYPAGTLVRTNGITYVIEDNNLIRQKDGTLKPANDALTNNYTIDIFTYDKNKANGGAGGLTNNPMEILYVPPTKASASQVQDIRNNPSKYIGN